MATEQTITISGTPTVVSGVTVPYVNTSDLEIYVGQGKVEKVVLNNAGAGYADATNAALEFSGGGGSSAALTVDVADGQVSLDNAGVPTNKGSGYTTAPIVGFGNISGGTAAAATAEIFTKKTVTTDYSVSGTSGSATLTFTSALSNGDKVLVKRVTDVTTAANTFNAGSAITAADLNNSFNQLRYKAEELPNVTSTALTNGDKGEISVSGDTWTIDNGVVTSAKLDTNIDIAGTLDVTSNSVFDANVNIKGDNKTFTIEKADGTDKFTVASQTGNTTVAGTLGVTGATTLTGALDANGGASIDNIQIGVTGDNEIDTSSGNLTIDSAGGTVAIDDNATISGTLGVTGATTMSGAATVDSLNINTSGIGQGDIGSNGGGDAVWGMYNTSNSGTISINCKDSGGSNKPVLDITHGIITFHSPVIFKSVTTVISSGSITPTTSHCVLQSESGTSDTLTNIAAGTDGQWLVLTNLSNHSITINETGNIRLEGSSTTLNNVSGDCSSFIYINSLWCQVSQQENN